MKIYIAYPILEQPYGGANQFLRALKNKFVENNVYTKEPSQSDVILFNGHHEVNLVHHLKNKFPNTNPKVWEDIVASLRKALKETDETKKLKLFDEADKLIEAFSEEVIYKMLKANVGTNVD